MGRNPCCSKEGLNKGAWTAMEDKVLTEYIKIHGAGKWRNLPKKAGLRRCGKSCRLRWLNYLRPGIKRGNITDDEEDLIIRLHNLLGNRWSLIAGRLPGRTDNEIKNYWNTIIGKKLQNQNPHQLKAQNSISLPSMPIVDNKIIEPTNLQPQQNIFDDIKTTMASPPSTSKLDWEENTENKESLSDLMLDFEMDGEFLFDMLNSDFCQLNGSDQCQPSPNSDEGKFVASDDQHATKEMGFPSISFREFDWLRD